MNDVFLDRLNYVTKINYLLKLGYIKSDFIVPWIVSL